MDDHIPVQHGRLLSEDFLLVVDTLGESPTRRSSWTCSHPAMVQPPLSGDCKCSVTNADMLPLLHLLGDSSRNACEFFRLHA